MGLTLWTCHWAPTTSSKLLGLVYSSCSASMSRAKSMNLLWLRMRDMLC